MGRTARATLALLLVLLLPVVLPVPIARADQPVDLVAVVPNPTAKNDAGERLVLAVPTPTNVTGWTVSDGESVAALPNRTLSGRIVATTDPDAVPRPAPNATVVALSGRLALSNAGETIVLRDPAGDVVETVRYTDAPEGERYVDTGDGWTWRIPGMTDLPVVTARAVPATLFVLPDDPSVPFEAIDGASERVLLAGYTFTSTRIERSLCAAERRGVQVEVLLEGGPIGGVPRREAPTLDRLTACGVPVSLLGGPGDRYAYHHAKYAVVDDRAVVLSENWKPAGVGGRSSRGWGVLLDSARVASALTRTFRADADFRDAVPWRAARGNLTFVDEPVANGRYPTRFPPTRVVLDRVDVLVTPDNAEAGLVRLIDGANRSVTVQQVSLGGLDGPFANATVRAARRDVQTRVLLSSAWYDEADNTRLVERLNRLGRRDGLPLRARLAHPRSRYGKIHVKGLLVDRRAAVVGSLNWNAHAARYNREVDVVLSDPAAAAYYGRVFRADWRGGIWRLPVGFGLAVVLTALGATLALWRLVAFEPAPGGGSMT